MNIALLTCAVFPTEAIARKKLWIFLKSIEKFGAPEPHLYGIGRGFPGYKMMKLDYQLDYLRTLQSRYTHALYTDSWDAFFVGPWDWVRGSYKMADCPPILTAAYHGLANVSEPDKDYPNCFNENLFYRYPHVGGYIAEIPAIIEAFERMNALPRQTGDDCFNWYDAWKEGWFRPSLDFGCSIFQTSTDDCVITGGRVFNERTTTTPCILHISGGYTDPETGKDDRLIPWAEKLGII